MAALKELTLSDVAAHGKPGDMWLAVDGYVYDLSKFGRMHPGGEVVLREWAGKDATEIFFEMHRTEVLQKYQRLRVGRLKGAGTAAVDKQSAPGALSPMPYGEVSAFQGFHSPYYTDSHRAFQKACRAWVSTHLAPHADQFDRAGKYPTREMFQRMGRDGIIVSRLGPGPWMHKLREWGITLPGGLAGGEFDQFHELIVQTEIARLGTPGFVDGCGAGHLIGVPPILNFASESMKQRLSKECCNGDKICVLAITEPFAGSDVANVRCTATKSPCGQYYIVNGVKKWITNAMFADYFITTVRTGGKGHGGLSMLLVERSEGLTCKQIVTSYSPSAGTGYVEYKDVKVPVTNLLGKENDGFRLVMHNFNHERWVICVNVLAQCRYIVDDCFRWAMQRKVFGKRLIEQPVIRAKLGNMIAQLESVWNWLEHISWQMQKMSFDDRQRLLGGPTALLKYQSTRVALSVADDAAQVFGGRAITRSGMGAKVEQFLRFVKYGAIYGGSEEICADLGVRQAMKFVPKDAKL